MTCKAKPGQPLTPAERQSLVYLAKGFSAIESARLRNVSVMTQRTLIRNVYVKLDVDSIAEAAVWAAKQGLV